MVDRELRMGEVEDLVKILNVCFMRQGRVKWKTLKANLFHKNLKIL